MKMSPNRDFGILERINIDLNMDFSGAIEPSLENQVKKSN